MKGLLLKDLYFTLQQKKMFLIILCFFFMFYITQGAESGPFVITYVTLMGGMFVLSTISWDEFDNSLSYLLTMPIKREDYVREKYLFGFLGTLGFWSVVTLAYVFLDFQNAGENLLMASIMLLVVLMFEMIMIPVQLKFGGDKGRIVLIGIVAGSLLLFSLGERIWKHLTQGNPEMKVKFYEMLEKFSKINPGIFVLIAAVILLAIGLVSYKNSLKTIKNREY